MAGNFCKTFDVARRAKAKNAALHSHGSHDTGQDHDIKTNWKDGVLTIEAVVRLDVKAAITLSLKISDAINAALSTTADRS